MKAKDNKNNSLPEWDNKAKGELHTSEWFGAIIRYFLHFGRRKFDTFYNKNELKKNVIIGWLFKILAFLLICSIVYQCEFNFLDNLDS